MTPLRRRYIEDLRLKNFSPNTIRVYLHAVAAFARFFGRSPEALGEEDVRQYLVHLVSDRRLSRSQYVLQLNALRHLYQGTLGRPNSLVDLPRPKREQRISMHTLRHSFATHLTLRAAHRINY